MDWYVIHTKPREEFRAEENLQAQGFETFLPKIAVEKLRNQKVQVVLEPMFARYLFIALDQVASNWFPIKSTRGVHQMVRFGTNSEPIKVPDLLIESLKKLPPSHQEAKALFQEHDPIQLETGPFKGLNGYFQKMYTATSGEVRAMVLIDLLGKVQTLAVPIQSLKKYA